MDRVFDRASCPRTAPPALDRRDRVGRDRMWGSRAGARPRHASGTRRRLRQPHSARMLPVSREGVRRRADARCPGTRVRGSRAADAAIERARAARGDMARAGPRPRGRRRLFVCVSGNRGRDPARPIECEPGRALRRRPAQAGARQAGHVAPGARERPWIRRVPRLSRCLSRLRVRNIEGDRPELLRFGRSSHGHTAHAVRGRFWKSSDSHRSSTPSSITNLVARLAL